MRGLSIILYSVDFLLLAETFIHILNKRCNKCRLRSYKTESFFRTFLIATFISFKCSCILKEFFHAKIVLKRKTLSTSNLSLQQEKILFSLIFNLKNYIYILFFLPLNSIIKYNFSLAHFLILFSTIDDNY